MRTISEFGDLPKFIWALPYLDELGAWRVVGTGFTIAYDRDTWRQCIGITAKHVIEELLEAKEVPRDETNRPMFTGAFAAKEADTWLRKLGVRSDDDSSIGFQLRGVRMVDGVLHGMLIDPAQLSDGTSDVAWFVLWSHPTKSIGVHYSPILDCHVKMTPKLEVAMAGYTGSRYVVESDGSWSTDLIIHRILSPVSGVVQSHHSPPTFHLEGSALPQMSGSPVFLNQDGPLRIVGVVSRSGETMGTRCVPIRDILSLPFGATTLGQVLTSAPRLGCKLVGVTSPHG